MLLSETFIAKFGTSMWETRRICSESTIWIWERAGKLLAALTGI
jgi:hypothetical protein